MKQEELNKIIANHVKWLNGDGGERAKLAGAELCGIDLSGANLQNAYLCEADLHRANLRMADFRRACLEGANLEGADLRGADLEGANLPIGIYQIVGSGSYNRCTTYDVINDQIVCGCWDDKKGNHLDSFILRIESIYGPNGERPDSVYYAEYMAAITFFTAMKELNKRV